MAESMDHSGHTKDSALKWSKFLKEKVVIAIWIDLCNGFSRHDIMQKLDNNLYDGIETNKLTKSMRYKVIQDGYLMAKEELDEQRDKQRELFYNRLLTVYNDSMVNNDRQSALKALDMFAKFGDLYAKQRVELSGAVQHDVVIDFQFDSNDENEES